MPGSAEDAGSQYWAGIFQQSGAAAVVAVKDKLQCCEGCWLAASPVLFHPLVTLLSQHQVLSHAGWQGGSWCWNFFLSSPIPAPEICPAPEIHLYPLAAVGQQ